MFLAAQRYFSRCYLKDWGPGICPGEPLLSEYLFSSPGVSNLRVPKHQFN